VIMRTTDWNRHGLIPTVALKGEALRHSIHGAIHIPPAAFPRFPPFPRSWSVSTPSQEQGRSGKIIVITTRIIVIWHETWRSILAEHARCGHFSIEVVFLGSVSCLLLPLPPLYTSLKLLLGCNLWPGASRWWASIRYGSRMGRVMMRTGP